MSANVPTAGRDPVIYIVDKHTDVVHLIRHWHSQRALCGTAVKAHWITDDETLSGLVATCRRCRTVYRPERNTTP